MSHTNERERKTTKCGCFAAGQNQNREKRPQKRPKKQGAMTSTQNKWGSPALSRPRKFINDLSPEAKIKEWKKWSCFFTSSDTRGMDLRLGLMSGMLSMLL
jgi:hypothetical protein